MNRKAVFYLDDDSMGSVYEVREVPEENKEQVEKAYADAVEQISNIDDEIAEAVLEEKEITPQMLKAGIRRQTIANKFVPVVGGSAFKNKGVQYLVDAVIDYLPGPLDIPPRSGWSRTRTRRWMRRRMTTANSARSRSNFGAIRLSASSSSFAFTPVRSRRAITFTTLARTSANASRA